MVAAGSKLSDSERMRLMTALKGVLVKEQEIDLLKEANALYKESGAENFKAYEAIQKRTDALSDEISRQRDANNAIGMSKQALAELAASRLDDAAASAMQRAETMQLINPDIAAEIKRQSDAYTELAKLKREGSLKEAIYDTAKKAEEEWKRAAQSIENSLTETASCAALKLARALCKTW